jgi:polar amino acid transport system substrate-binding protein
MAEFLRLVGSGAVNPGSLTTHRIAIDQANDAYELVTGKKKEAFTGVVLTYPDVARAGERRKVEVRPRAAASGKVRLGFIGAGNFATAVLLPRFKKANVDLVGVATSTGVSARTTADRFGFGYAATENTQILDDAGVEAVVIAIRHGSHARLAAQALRAGKAVFVEKPLAITQEGLEEVINAVEETGGTLTVGFNRRFSPLVSAVRDAFTPSTPLVITYRVNAGSIPKNSWIHDPEDGGGRVIGEGCHFIDTMQFLTRDEPVEVYAQRAGGSAGDLHDTLTISIRFLGGSIATLVYVANGDRSFPKERIEVFGGGVVGVVDDFKSATITKNGRTQTHRRMAQDKGFDEEIAAFLTAVRGGEGAIPLASLVATTRATFAIERSLRTGTPVSLAGATDAP